MDKNVQLVAQVVSQLADLGITAVENPSHFNAYRGAWGSLANYKKVTLGEISEMRNPLGEVQLGVFVKYEALSEAGEDFCDYTATETRNVPLDKLIEYLASKGICAPRQYSIRLGIK